MKSRSHDGLAAKGLLYSFYIHAYMVYLIKQVEEYTLFQNGRHFSVLLFACKLALVASFKGKCSFEFRV